MDIEFNSALKRDLKILKNQTYLLKKILRDKNPDVEVIFKYGKRKIHDKIEPESLRNYIINHFIEKYDTEAGLHEMSIYRPKTVRTVKTSAGFEAWRRKQMKKTGMALHKVLGKG